MSSQPSKSRRPFPRVPFLGGFAVLAGLAATEASAPGRFEGRQDGGVADVELDGGVPERTPVDTERGRVLTGKAGPPVPVRPEPWQKTGACLPDAEERLMGACYVRTAKKPPCPPSFFEYDSACFVAVAKVPRPNTSIEE